MAVNVATKVEVLAEGECTLGAPRNVTLTGHWYAPRLQGREGTQTEQETSGGCSSKVFKRL